MRHGAPLVCSFPACRDKGVKFLYCAYCKDACAKRQFRERHKHDDDTVSMQTCPIVSSAAAARTSSGGNNSTGYGWDGSLVCSITSAPEAAVSERTTISSSDNSSKHHPRAMKRKRPSVSGPNLSIPTGRTNNGGGRSCSSSGSGNKCGECGTTTGGTDDISDDLSMQQRIRSMQQEGRMEAWTSLLVNRPDDKNDEAMASWLMKVMAVSDPSRPIKEVLGHLKMHGPIMTVGLTSDDGTAGNKRGDDPLGKGTNTSNSSPSTELVDSHNDSSLSSGKRSSYTGDDDDVNRMNMQDGASNASSEDFLSSENQEASNDDERDSPSSSSPTENDSSDEDNQDETRPSGRKSREVMEVCT